jgi:hypothetical protein
MKKHRVIPFKFTSADFKAGEKINVSNPLDFLKEKYSYRFSFGLNSLQANGFFKLNGWAYDFRPFLKLYVVKQYDHWQEFFAPNKTLLRKSLFGRIQRVVEIKQDKKVVVE